MHADGGSRGNPGPSGIGVVITDADGNVLKEVARFVGTRTNNWTEYEAVIVGLETLKKIMGSKKLKDISVEVKLDSELVVKQLLGEYQIKEETLCPQFLKIHNMHVKDFPRLTFTHVLRDKNKRADQLANDAMDGEE